MPSISNSNRCRVSGGRLDPLFSLGDLYVSGFSKEGTTETSLRSELSLCFNQESRLAQLSKTVPPNLLYGKYWYRSGTNVSMRNALKEVVDSVLDRIHPTPGDVWLDIACNDGTLLSFVPPTFTRIGVDPVDDSFRVESEQHSDIVIQSLFDANVYRKCRFGNEKAKVITVIAMFYDLDNPASFLQDIYSIMDDDGLLILQLSYTPLMIKQLAFDNICHEHVCYYSLVSLMSLLEGQGLGVVDCELNEVNGGSFRVYIKKSSHVGNFKTSPFRDVADFRTTALVTKEELEGYNTPERYMCFYEDILQLRTTVMNFIKDQVSKGKRVWAYGASTKGNTLLQWYGLDLSLIEGIADRSPYKYELKTIGSDIPIYSEETMRKNKPDYLLILPWHFVEEFRYREREYLGKGGAFIIPCPRFEVIRGG